MVQKEINMNEPVELTIQDCIEILTNIKLKHGNLPVYLTGHIFPIVQDDVRGIQYYTADVNFGIPERVEIT